MQDRASELRGFAAKLAAGPSFLVLGHRAQLGESSLIPRYRWSGVYTSRTDKALADGFRSDWRTVASIGAMAAVPSRNQTGLRVCYLLGGAHLPPGQRPAQDVLESADSRLRALQELARLASETVTPRGSIAIDGWLPDDPLVASDVVPALRALGPGQAHLFSAGAWANDPYVRSLAQSGQIELHLESLDRALTRLSESGSVKLDEAASDGRTPQHVIALGDGFVEIDVHTWNQVRRSARPVDLDLMTPPVFSSDAARYQEFRSFAGAPEGAPRWRGLAAGMSVVREFEVKLAETVNSLLAERDLPDPVLVSGQTATGKSVALASLAMSLARAGDFAVLHQPRRTVRPSFDDIDMYAAWAEDRGARATVLIWDGMVEAGEYEALARQLKNRGRKVLIVGSAYVTDSDGSHIIDAPAELSQSESAQLVKLLGSFGVDVEVPKDALDSSFLAFLYHALPETESALRHGLAHEMRAAEKGMQKLVRAAGSDISPATRVTAMAAAFQAAGLVIDNLNLADLDETSRPLREQSFLERDSIQRVTTLVLIAGRHGVPVPIDLALRILGREGSQSIRDALHAFDIIREIDDDSGEYFLVARSNLEAELLAQHEIPLEVEIEVVAEVIHNARALEGFTSGADEVQFVVSLLERVGPNSGTSKYRPYFVEIAEALRARREHAGRPHPRLVLQESNFTRGYVHWQQEAQQGTSADRIATLEHNRDLLEDVLADPGLRGLMRLSLTVELASTLGAIMHEIQKDSTVEHTTNLVTRLDDILNAVMDARAIDPGNLHPVDVLAWSTRDAILTEALSPQQRLDRLANAVATIESVDRGMLSPKQLAQLDRRAVELNRLLGNDDALWENLRSLESNADPAAIYFLAKFEAESGPPGKRAALRRLWDAPAPARMDWRCARLLLDLAWQDVAGTPLLRGERAPVHLAPDAATQLIHVTQELRDADSRDRYRLLFVEAVANFALGNYADATGAFREVENLTRQLARRIHTVLVLANEAGKPEVFTGRIEWLDGRWGKVRVEELATSVWFEPRLFSASQELSRNQQLPAFIIGFKLSRGVVAEPRSLYREPRGR